ncbi:hypothetical protein KAI87_08745, partial [Myxococcota bacterium]|nr:hypothetical protein [Myxococcota bacterium]
MILLVTNNDFTRAAFETALAKSSWDLVIKSVDDAPKYLSTRMPEMILIPAHSAHVRGFEFRTQYREEHTDRSTPFLFLVHRDGPDNVFDDIQFGEDDFICQPILDGYLNAKIRAVLERFESCSLPVFDGQISDFPFARILQFCERTGLTGEVSIQSGDSKKVL